MEQNKNNNNNNDKLLINLTSVSIREQQSGNDFDISVDLYVEREINKSDFLDYVKRERRNDFNDFILNQLIYENLDVENDINDGFYEIFSDNNYYELDDVDFNTNDEAEAILIDWEEEAEAILNGVNNG